MITIRDREKVLLWRCKSLTILQRLKLEIAGCLHWTCVKYDRNLRDIVTKAINPTQDKLKIIKIANTKNDSLRMTVRSKEDVNKSDLFKFLLFLLCVVEG